MNGIGCEQARDWLPTARRGELGETDRAALERHLSACPDCRHEAALVWRVLAAAPAAPPGLAARVQAALRAELATSRAGEAPEPRIEPGDVASASDRPKLHLVRASGGRERGSRRPAWMPSLRGLALAASLVVMVGVATLVRRSAEPTPSTAPEVAADVLDDGGLAGVSSPLAEWPGATGVVAGGAVLDGLSDAQLQTLLKEMGS